MARAKVAAGGIIRTSLDCTWQTPQWILDRARVYFGGPIPFDPASAPENPTKALRFLCGAPGSMFEQQTGQNGLAAEWPAKGTFCNPPYGGQLKDWLQKFRVEASLGNEIVALLPCSRWETGYFQQTLEAAEALCLIRGRVAFVSSADGTEVAGGVGGSMLVGFNVDLLRWCDAFSEIGGCWNLRVMA